MPLKLLIWLQHSVSAFSWNSDHEQFLKSQLGEDSLIYQCVATERDMLNFLPSAHILITWQFRREWYPLATQLKLILTPAAGHDWINLPPCEMKISIYHGQFHGILMRESLLWMMLNFLRKGKITFQLQANKEWNRDLYSDCALLAFQTVLFWGYGRIARSCAQVLKVFGAKIIAVKRNISQDYPEVTWLVQPQDVYNFLPMADHVVLILPAVPENKRIFGRKEFASMKPSAYFYNLGRGMTCDENALLDALYNKMIAGAGLDVFDQEPLPPSSPLWDCPNVILLPHATAISSYYIPLFLEEIIPVLRYHLLHWR